jgi:FkbM family methyltransferase
MIDKIGKREDGLYWPIYDTICYKWTIDEAWIPKFLSKTCDELNIPKRTVIHAGGNVGKYALDFAEDFANVYVFEPDNLNFACLALNCAQTENIFPFKSALGAQNGTTKLINNTPDSCGNMQTTGGDGKIPVLTIDNLSLTDVSLIHLDVEGYELFIIQGAMKTIERCHPLIAFEVTGAYADYGITIDDINSFMASLGYTTSMQYGNEVMFYYET